MTVTDHSPTAAYAGGLTIDRLHEQWDEIGGFRNGFACAPARDGIRPPRGRGAGLSGRRSRTARCRHASIHARYRMDATTMTGAWCAPRVARVQPGDPLGRLLMRRPPIACDVEAVLDAAAGARAPSR